MFANKYILYVALILVAIVFIWVVRKYFHKNTQQLKNKKGKFVDHSFKTDAAAANTIIESNNALSKKPFDGINRNPVHYSKNSPMQNQNKGRISDKGVPDIANETVKDQPGDRRS
jgi:hypothetical protein